MALILQEIQYKTEHILSDNEIWTTTLRAVNMYLNELHCTTYRYGCPYN
jgi:hypothetical protein